MKTLVLLALLLVNTAAFAGYTPLVEVSLSNDKTIHVQITNDSGTDLVCKYSVSWLINHLTYQRQFGSISMNSGAVTEFAFPNDQYAHLSRIKAKVDCN